MYCECCGESLSHNPWYSFFIKNGIIYEKPVCDRCIKKCGYILKEKDIQKEVSNYGIF